MPFLLLGHPLSLLSVLLVNKALSCILEVGSKPQLTHVDSHVNITFLSLKEGLCLGKYQYKRKEKEKKELYSANSY